MKQCIPNSSCPKILVKHRQQQRRSQQLHNQSRLENKPGQTDNSAHIGRRNGLLHGASLHKSDFSS